MEQQLYARDLSRLDELLLLTLRNKLGLSDNTVADPQITALKPHEHTDGMKFLIPNFVLDATDHIIYGPPGTGKTQLALHMARALTGDPSVTQFLDSGPLNLAHHWKRSRVLFIQSDMQDTGRKNTISMLRSYGLMDNAELLDHLRFCFQDNSKQHPGWRMDLAGITYLHRALLKAKEDKRPYKVVVIDSLKACAPDSTLVGQQQFMLYLRTVNNLCQHHGAAVIWVHHVAPETKRAQGVARITEETSALIRLEKHQSDEKITTCTIEKLRGQGKSRIVQMHLMGVKYPELAFVPQADDDDSTSPTGQRQRETAIIEILTLNLSQYRMENPSFDHGRLRAFYPGLSISDLMTALNARHMACSSSKLRSILQALTQQGRIIRKGQSKSTAYRIPLDGDHAEPTDAFTDFDD
jgi:KaiC/GvpD/RAD55 family RecA-like ATPase